jgi:hypothetical protein
VRKILRRVTEIRSSYVNTLISSLDSPIVTDITFEKEDFCGQRGERKRLAAGDVNGER